MAQTTSGLDTDLINGLLEAFRNGDRTALKTLLDVAYEDLLRIAENVRRSRHDRDGDSLANAFVVQRLGPHPPARFESVVHFRNWVAWAMRNMLIDDAKRRQREARVKWQRPDRLHARLIDDPEALLSLDELLRKLETRYPRAAAVFSLRFLSGRTVTQTGRLLGIRDRAVEKDYALAVAILQSEWNRP